MASPLPLHPCCMQLDSIKNLVKQGLAGSQKIFIYSSLAARSQLGLVDKYRDVTTYVSSAAGMRVVQPVGKLNAVPQGFTVQERVDEVASAAAACARQNCRCAL